MIATSSNKSGEALWNALKEAFQPCWSPSPSYRSWPLGSCSCPPRQRWRSKVYAKVDSRKTVALQEQPVAAKPPMVKTARAAALPVVQAVPTPSASRIWKTATADARLVAPGTVVQIARRRIVPSDGLAAMTRSVLWSRLPWVLVALLGLTNALLVGQNSTLRREAAAATQLQAVRVGDRLPLLQGWGYSDDVEFTYGEMQRTRILLYLSPSCAFCSAQLPGWRALVGSLDPESHEVYAIAGDHETPEVVRAYLESAGLASVPVAFVTSKVRLQYGLRYTPTTMLIANDGTIEKIWTGLWNEQAKQEAVELFNLDPSSIE